MRVGLVLARGEDRGLPLGRDACRESRGDASISTKREGPSMKGHWRALDAHPHQTRLGLVGTTRNRALVTFLQSTLGQPAEHTSSDSDRIVSGRAGDPLG